MIRRLLAYPIAAIAIGWLLLGCCHKTKPTVHFAAPPIVTVAPATECILPARPGKPPMFVEEIEDGRLAASQFLWADIVGYVAAAEAYADAALACLTAQAAQP